VDISFVPLRIKNEKGCLARDSREAAFFRFQSSRRAAESRWRGGVRGEGDSLQTLGRIGRNRLKNIY
jgi:hypothetical protein